MNQGTQTGALSQCRGVGWGGREVQEGEETYVYLWLIHVDIWQKPTLESKHPPIKNKSIFKKHK